MHGMPPLNAGAEFPPGVSERPDELSRRGFVKLLGASMALAGLDGCTRMPAEKILPYVHQPPEAMPEQTLHYATTMLLDGYGTGLLVESHEGRPTKVEGNPDHPASLGAAGVWEQASVLQLYDPDRARAVREARRASTWAAFATAFAPDALRRRVGARGAGLRLLLAPTSSPLEAELIARLRTLYPDAGVHFYAPFAGHNGSRAFDAGGRAIVPQYDLSTAAVILALDADVFGSMPFRLRYARQFADGRRLARSTDAMNRLYVAEASRSVTGTSADHRIRVAPRVLPLFARAIASRVAPGASGAAADVPGIPTTWLDAIARDLRANAGRSVVVAGPRSAAEVQAAAHVINEALGNIGRTVWYTESPLLGAGDEASGIAPLVEALRAKQVDTLICAGGNPVYTTPGELDVAALVRATPNTAYLGLYDDETARACQWLVPAAHYLEAWGDARAYDGTASIIQPLVQPLFGGRSRVELLAMLTGDTTEPRMLLEHRWRATASGGSDADEAWRALLQRGVQANSANPRVSVRVRPELLAAPIASPSSGSPPTVELVIAPDAKVYDGRFANNGWLQELPEPITKLTWDNALEMSVADAQRLGAATGDVMELETNGRSLRVPAIIVPGHASGAMTLRAGYGRVGAEHVARGVGANAYALWPASAWSAGAPVVGAVAVRRAGGASARALAITQSHWDMHGRDAARAATLAEYRAHPEQVGQRRGRVLSLFEPQPVDTLHSSGQQWAMTIDLGTCVGCGGCIVACQAENNIPVVGHDDVANSREMQWLRIDRYLSAETDDARTTMQPMLCQHCEQAPCEYVCPVGATVHSPDGLNEMVYNRCVGTRFCSNNCPYKVRRFNWFDYNQRLSETEMMQKNPDVTVRERGVMEKCTFCVQRIREAEIAAARDGRPLRGDEVRTACQQACPTEAIVFGSLTDGESEMMRRRAQPRSYAALGDLGTEPRVRYLAAIRNENPDMGPDA
jgi:molybdopterin-containing oxidoreductase family iron-sulfur binding subunit